MQAASLTREIYSFSFFEATFNFSLVLSRSLFIYTTQRNNRPFEHRLAYFGKTKCTILPVRRGPRVFVQISQVALEGTSFLLTSGESDTL